MKDKSILHTDSFSVLVPAHSSAKQPSKFIQAPENFTAATENWVGSYKTPQVQSPGLVEVWAVEMWQQSAQMLLPAFPSTYSTTSQTLPLPGASLSRLEKHILKKKPRKQLLNEYFLKPLQIHFHFSEIWLHIKMSEEPEAVHNTEQNKDRMSLCVPITPNIQTQQILPPTAFISKIILVSTFGRSKQENSRLCLTDHRKSTWGKLVVSKKVLFCYQ